jgi:hypothetical protein
MHIVQGHFCARCLNSLGGSQECICAEVARCQLCHSDEGPYMRVRTEVEVPICTHCGQVIPCDPLDDESVANATTTHEAHCQYRQTLEAAGVNPANPIC